MNGQQLRVLFWKDIRLNRTILIFGGCLVVFAYVVAMALDLYANGWGGTRNWREVMGYGAPMAIASAALTVILLSANVMGVEYADRSASFVAYLPPTRQCVLASKILAALVPVVLLSAIAVGAQLAGAAVGQLTLRRSDVTLLLAFMWLLFTVSWPVGLITRSSPIGLAAGIVMPIALYMVMLVLTHEPGQNDGPGVQDGFSITASAVGAMMFGAAVLTGLCRKT